jgi:hypothetical protein
MLLYKVYKHRYVDQSGTGIVKDLELCIKDWPSSWTNDMFIKDIIVHPPQDNDVSYRVQSSYFHRMHNRVCIEFTFSVPYAAKVITDNIVLDLHDLAEDMNGAIIHTWHELINQHQNQMANSKMYYDEYGDIDFDIITNKEYQLSCQHEISDHPMQNPDDSLNQWYYCKKKNCGHWLKRF